MAAQHRRWGLILYLVRHHSNFSLLPHNLVAVYMCSMLCFKSTGRAKLFIKCILLDIIYTCIFRGGVAQVWLYGGSPARFPLARANSSRSSSSPATWRLPLSSCSYSHHRGAISAAIIAAANPRNYSCLFPLSALGSGSSCFRQTARHANCIPSSALVWYIV